MEVLGFQVFFFVIIVISGLFGKKPRNIVVVGSVIFTLLMVFMNWLIILQLLTISFAYLISENFVSNSNDKLNNLDKKYGKGCIIFIVLFGVLSIVLKIIHSNVMENISVNKTNEKIKSHDNFEIDTTSSINYESTRYSSENNYNNENFSENTSENIYEATENSNENTISEFIIAENDRNIILMNYYLSDTMSRFWKIENPSLQDVNNSYYKTWRNFSYTNTNIIEINKIDSDLYSVKVNYEFDSNFRESNIYFKFDKNGKIISMY